MSQKVQKQENELKIDEIKHNVRPDKEINGTVDRARMSWLLNLVLNQKTQQEIVKDIADGILDFKEIEDIFPRKFVLQLRQYSPEHTQDYINRFKNMTDERIHELLSIMLSRKSRNEILKLITDYSLSLDNIQKSYLHRLVEENEEDESSTTPNVPTSSERLSSKNSNSIEVQNSKESKDVGTKKKRNTMKKGEKDVETKKKEKNIEKVAKRVRVVKLKNEKSVGGIKDENKVEGPSKEISSMEENPLPYVDSEKAQCDLTESLMQTHYEESLLKSSQEDQATYESLVQRDTKKTANSKSLANDDAKLAGAKKASKKVGKDVKPGTRNKGKGEVENFASLSRSDDYIEEEEKPKSDESDIENARTSYAIRNYFFPETRSSEGFEDSFQKSNQVTNITSTTNQEQVAFKKVDSQKKLRTKRNNVSVNTKLSSASGSELENVAGRSKTAKAKKNRNCSQEEATTDRKAKDTRHKEKIDNRWSKMRRLDRKDRRKREELRRHLKKMEKAMAQLSDQVVKLVKKMKYLEEDDSSSESCSCSSCSCCDYSSSDEYSEYTLFSSSNCGSSCSCTDSDHDKEE